MMLSVAASEGRTRMSQHFGLGQDPGIDSGFTAWKRFIRSSKKKPTTLVHRLGSRWAGPATGRWRLARMILVALAMVGLVLPLTAAPAFASHASTNQIYYASVHIGQVKVQTNVNDTYVNAFTDGYVGGAQYIELWE